MNADLGYLRLSIDYDEGRPDSYRGVVLESVEKEVARFASGDPVRDWADYLTYAKQARIRVLEGSSVTHFVFDNPEWRFKLNEEGHEILVPEDRPEWLEAGPNA